MTYNIPLAECRTGTFTCSIY